MKMVLYTTSVALTSCQKVINVDLNGSSPQYVIEGNVTDQGDTQKVKITRSVNFSDRNTFPEATGAFVTVRDATSGELDTLEEATPGMYINTKLAGIPGHSYELFIKVDGREFTSTSIMPDPVSIDSILTEKSVFGGSDLFAVPYYLDPMTKGNYYKLTQSVNHKAVKGYDIRSDEVVNGQVSKFPLYYDTDNDSGNPKIHPGDSVSVSLQTIDRNVYEFYRTLQETIDQNSAALANPLTNIKGGALGYFSASAVSIKSTLVK
jgi:hypothetical protein